MEEAPLEHSCPPPVCPSARPEPSPLLCSLLARGPHHAPLFRSGRSDERLEGRVQRAKTPAARTPSPPAPGPSSPAGGALPRGPGAPASRGHNRRGPQAPASSTSRSPRAKRVPKPQLGQGGVWDVGALASVLPGPGPQQEPQLARAEGHLPGAGAAAAGNRYGLWVPRLPPLSSQRDLPSSPFPWTGPCTLCRKTPGRVAGPLPAFHSLLLLHFAELFLNSLSQPFSLEEQEQILSCLSVDSLSLSDDSEKVSRP